MTADCRVLSDFCDGLSNLRNPVEMVDSQVLRVGIDSADLQNLIWLICELVPKGSWEEVRCCLIPASARPTPEQWMRSEGLDLLRKKVDAHWLREIIHDGRLVTFFQPIISNKPPYRVYAYECLIRGLSKDEQLITPWQLFSAARGAGLMNRLDHAARLKSIETARKLNPQVRIFINFNPKFISNNLTDLAETMEAVIGSGVSPDRFVFEVVESEEIEDVGKLHEIINYCRKTGCRVALDDVGAGYNSLNNLPEVRPDYIKLDMELVKDVHKDHYKSRVASKLLELARELNLISIMEGIENLETWEWVRNHGADYSQGYLFARPAACPPTPIICQESLTITEDSASLTFPPIE